MNMVDMYSSISSRRAQRGLALPGVPQVGHPPSGGSSPSSSLMVLQRVSSVCFHLFLYFLFFSFYKRTTPAHACTLLLLLC